MRKKTKTLIIALQIGFLCAFTNYAKNIPAGVNLLKNSTLKECHNPGMPDFWVAPLSLPSIIKNWYTMDVIRLAKNCKPPLPGVNVLRFKKYADLAPNYNYFGAPSYLRNMPAGKYTFSAYMKSESDSMAVQFSTAYWGGKRAIFKVGKKWTRFNSTFDFKGGTLVVKLDPKVSGVLYFAAPKLELGDKASSYKLKGDKVAAKVMSAIKSQDCLKSLSIPLTKKLPKLDGRLDKNEWTAATKLEGFKTVEGMKPSNDTEVFLLRSPRAFYIAYKCKESAPEKIVTKLHKRHGRNNVKIFGDDVVETFVGAGDDYVQFVTNLNGVQFDAAGKNSDWNSKWNCVAGKQKDCWVVEIEIPLASLPFSFSKNPITMNFCRTRKAGGKSESSSWSAANGGFHALKDLVEIDNLKPSETKHFDWEIGDVKVAMKGKKAFLTATVNRKPEGIKDIEARVKIGSKGKFSFKKMTLPSGPCNIEVDRIIPDLKVKRPVMPVEIQICNASNGAVLKSLWLRLPILSECKASASFEFNYYTDDEAARLKIKNAPNDVDQFRVKLDGLAFDKLFDINERIIEIPLKSLPDGKHATRIVFLEKGTPKGEVATCFKKLTPVKNEVRIHNWKRCLALKTQPWFPVYFHSGMTELKKQWLREDAKEHGFNTLHVNMRFLDIKDLNKKEKEFFRFLDKCNENGFKVILCVTNHAAWIKSTHKRPFEDLVAVWTSVAKRFASHPAILAWDIIDEPGKATWEGRGFEIADLRRLYQAVKKADPYHPAYVNWCHAWQLGQQPYGGYDCTDIVSYDQYPFAVCGGMRKGPQAIDAIASYSEMINRPSGGFRPGCFWVQTYGGLYDGGVEPTPEEVKCMVFLNLVSGTRVFGYYAGRPFCEAQWKAQKEANSLTQKMSKKVFFADNSRHISNAQYGKIKLSIWQVGQEYVVAAINYGYAKAELNYGLAAYFDVLNMSAETWIGEGSPEIRNGRIVDAFEPLQGKVYRISKKSFWSWLF